MPKNLLSLSIITPCLNRVQFVAEAVESVRQQDYAQVEHIIMDGGSTDGTLEALSHYPSLKVYSQPDKGIYDALNKGIHLAQGDIIGFLNTDDLYEPGIFGTITRILAENPQADALVGGASIFYKNSHSEEVALANFTCIYQNTLLERATLGAPIFNAWFFRRRILDELNGFDLRYLYIADRDFLIRMAFHNKSYCSLDKPVYRYRMHAGSYTLSGQDSGEAAYMFESRALAESYLQSKSLKSRQRKYFRAWHSQITMEQVRSAWRQRAFRRMARYILIGLRFNISWPLIFTRTVLERLPYILGRSSLK